MRKREMERLNSALVEKRDALVRELDLLRGGNDTTMKEAAGDLSSHAHHMADLGSDTEEREKNFQFASNQKRFLYHIDEAIRRIREGSYGDCQSCGSPIAYERLLAVPHARLCIECKEKEERGATRSARS